MCAIGGSIQKWYKYAAFRTDIAKSLKVPKPVHIAWYDFFSKNEINDYDLTNKCSLIEL